MPASGFGHACDEMGVANLVRDAARQGLTVRATGTGHSFSALCVSDGLLLSLDRLRGVVAADVASRTAVMRAGTPLHELGVPLRAAGLAMETIGDIDRETLAGAISTGTHGSGPTLGNISTQVVGLLLVTADGEIVDCSAEREPELFRAARVSLGALGVIEVRLRVLPVYRLHERTWSCPFEECVAALDSLVLRNLLLFLAVTYGRLRHEDVECDQCRARTSARTGERIDHSDRVLPSERLVNFTEIELAVPAASGPDCLREIRALMRARYRRPGVASRVARRTNLSRRGSARCAGARHRRRR